MLDNIYTIMGFISAIVGIIWFIWYFYEKNFPFRKLSWKFAEKKAQEVVSNMIKDNFSPTLIVGIGRGGAIFGAMISGCLGHRPLLVIDRQYKWKKDGRVDDMIFSVDVPTQFLHRILLVAGEIHSGGTMRIYYDYFCSLGAKEIKKAVLFFEEGCPINIDYIGIQSSKKNILMPWMFSKRYVRADRKPPNPILTGEKSSITLYLVRHGRTRCDDENRFCGVSNLDLTEKGIEQAISLGRFFKSIRIKYIYTSERKQAIETAKIIQALNLNSKMIIDKNLNEMDFGKWEGLTRDTVKKTFKEEHTLWEKDPINNPIPYSESIQNVLKRALNFLKEIERKHKDETIVCISHETVMRILLSHFKGTPLSLYRQYNLDNCSFIKFVFDGERWEIKEYGIIGNPGDEP